MRLPQPRGPITEVLFDALSREPGSFEGVPVTAGEPLGDEDLQLGLYVCYELHYRGFRGVDDRWEWDPRLLATRGKLEGAFAHALRERVVVSPSDSSIEQRLTDLVRADRGPSLSSYIRDRATGEQVREFVVHRSAYQLKEADPHTWAIPRLWGAPKAAMIEIQSEEYGEGEADAMHSSLFASVMRSLGLDPEYGAYLDAIPAVTLATVNLMSMFGLHRRWRGAIVGHLAAFEMTSTEPNRRYVAGLRRLGFEREALHFFVEHVEADATHEIVAARDLAGGLAAQDPTLSEDILFGAAALLELEGRLADHLIGSWSHGRTSLREPVALALSA